MAASFIRVSTPAVPTASSIEAIFSISSALATWATSSTGGAPSEIVEAIKSVSVDIVSPYPWHVEHTEVPATSMGEVLQTRQRPLIMASFAIAISWTEA